MSHERPHCSELPDVKIPKPRLTLIRHFLLQDDGSSVEEGFSVTLRDNWEHVRHTNERVTDLTEAEAEQEGWDDTEEDILERAEWELGNQDSTPAPVLEGIKYLLNLIEQQDNRIAELARALAEARG